MKKKFFAIVLCMALIVTMLPFNAFAEEAESQDMNTDISAQEVEQADDAESNISEAEQESDNEAEKSRALMPASAAAGSIADVSWDDNENAVYNVVTESDIYVSAGSESNYFSIGKMESGKFCPAEGAVDSCSITVNRDDWNEPVSKDKPTWSNPLRVGGFEGCYDFDEEALYLGFNENAIFLGEDAYGAYQVTVNWTAGGTEYSAEMVLNLKPAEMLTRGYFSGSPDSWEKDAGFSKSFYINEHLEMKDSIYRLKYAPCIDYESRRENRIMIFSDGEHGILNFKGSNCDIEGLFAAGESVKYKSDVTVTPMTVDYSKVTADIMGKVYALTFADSSGNEVTCRICFEKDETVDRLEDGRLYTIEAYEDPIVKNGNIYVSSVEWQLSDCVELTVKTAKTLFFGIWRAETQQLELAKISIDELGENMSLEECEGGSYMISSDVSGSGNLRTANGETIKYTSTLPSCGVYSASEKSDENYLTDQISLNETGKEFYLIVDGNGTEKNELQLNISVQEAFSASYYGEDTKGDNKYFVWKITASDGFEPEDDGIGVDFKILKNNRYYDSIWLNISYTIAAEQQLYWFYDYEASVDSNGMIETEAEGELQHTRIWAEVNRIVTGYFAVKTESGSYKAVDSVISDSPDDLIVTKAEDGYVYNLKWAKEGNYICRATAEGKEYRIKASFNLPSMGFYSTEDRSIDSSLGDEFHYIDAADENNKEAYFYIITGTCGYEADEVTMTCGRWVRGEWKAKDVNGISIEAIPTSEKYFVYKVIVSDQYRADEDGKMFALVNDNGECLCDNWIRIYDSTEISQEQQMYWFDSWKVETDSEGMLSIPTGEEYSFEDVAYKTWKSEEPNGSKSGYFAVKDDDGNYYALKNVTVLDNNNIELLEKGFKYRVKWKNFGEFIFEGIRNDKPYKFRLSAELPSVGFYSRPERSAENYLEEFYFADAAEKNTEGTESYFYIIAPTNGYETDDLKIKTGVWIEDEGYEDKEIEGISIVNTENSGLDSGKYCVWKVTVTDEYKEKYSNSAGINFKVMYSENEWNSNSIYINDAEAILHSQQLYWFDDRNVTADSEGMLSIPADEEYSFEDVADETWKSWNPNESNSGYFAVKTESGSYKAVGSVVSDAPDDLIVTKAGEGYTYNLKWTKEGNYICKAVVGEKEYRIKASCNLPSMGVYSTNDRSVNSYLGNEFHYIDAAEKNEEGTESYFYIITDTCGYEPDKVTMTCERWKTKDVKGISIEYIPGSEKYFVYKVTVSKRYRAYGENEFFELVDNNSGRCLLSEWIRLYDSTEVPEDEQLYWFNNDRDIKVNSNGKLSLSSDSRYDSLEEKAEVSFVFSNRVDDSWGIAGCFAVKDDKGDFYAIKNVDVSNKEKMKILNVGGFEYVIQEIDFGEYRFTAGKDNKIYKFNVSVLFPEMGFYKHDSISSENYIEDFSFTEAAEKNEDGTKAYFYVIAEADDYEESDVKMSVGDWDEDGKWCPVIIKGLSFGDPEKQTIDSEDYFVCKVTVSNDYRSDRDIKRVALTDNEGTMIRNRGIMIYDSAKISPEQQMYWFDEENVDVNENNQIILKYYPESDSETVDWYDRDEQIINTDRRSGSETGYFTYRAEDGTYYILEDVKAVDSENIDITADGKKFCVRWTDFGEYHFECKDGDREYKFNWYVNLPHMGAYSKPEKTVDTYLDNEFHFVNAADKESDGSKAYFYIINRYSGENYNMKAKGSYGKEIEGVSIGYDKKMTDDSGNIYYCWKVTVTKEFQKAKANVCFTVLRKNSNEDWADQYVTVYGADEETRMYCLPTGLFKANEQTGLISSEREESENYIDDEIYTEDTGEGKYYFAVRKKGKYYAVDSLRASDEDKVKITSSSDRSFKISWSAFGKYQLTGTYDDTEYSMELIVELPNMGFYSSPDRSADKYLGKEMYFEDIPQKSKDKKEAVAYFITPAYSGKDNIKIEVGQYIWNSDRDEMEWQAENNDGIVFSNPKEAVFGTGKYCVWEVHIGDKYKLNRNYQIAAINTESQKPFDFLYNIVIHNADEVVPSQQIYYFLKYEEGTVENKGTLGDLICGVDYGFYYCAILKDGEYYKVDIADAKGIRYSVNETSGAITLIPENTGEYTITAVYDGKRYYSKGMIVLSDVGFWSEPNRSYETLLKEFNYNTADDKKHFYYISPSGYYWDDNAEILDVKDIVIKPYTWERGGNCIEASGIKIGECGSFTEAGQTYYYWEVIVDKSFDAESTGRYVHMQYNCSGRNGQSIAIKITGYKNYEDSVSVSGTVTSSDNTDNAEMMLYCVKDLKIFVEEEYTDSKAEAYIKSDIISTSHHSSSATEKGRITGAGGIYSQTYKFADVAAGEYKLAVYKPGYGVHIEDVTVTDSTVIGDIKLSLLGDANGDGKVRIGDKAILARAIAGWTGYDKLLNKEAADINGDGLIKNDDLMILSRHLAGWLGYSQLEYGRQQIKTE